MVDLEAYYRGSLKGRLADLEAQRDALRAGERPAADALRRMAHTLKGTGTSFGFPQITRLAEATIEAPASELDEAVEAMIDVVRRVASGAEPARVEPTPKREARGTDAP